MSEQGKVVVQQKSIGWLGLLGVIFVLLKLFGLTEVATWSWWWVTAPFWIGFAIVVGVLLVGAIGAGLLFTGACILDWWDRRRRRAAWRRKHNGGS
jgi:hypothetical protein